VIRRGQRFAGQRDGEKVFAIEPFRAGLLSPAYAVLVVA
jgi:hypothetical protein